MERHPADGSRSNGRFSAGEVKLWELRSTGRCCEKAAKLRPSQKKRAEGEAQRALITETVSLCMHAALIQPFNLGIACTSSWCLGPTAAEGPTCRARTAGLWTWLLGIRRQTRTSASSGCLRPPVRHLDQGRVGTSSAGLLAVPLVASNCRSQSRACSVTAS